MVLPGETRTDREDTAVSSTIRTQKERCMSVSFLRDMCAPPTTAWSLWQVDAFNQHWIDGWLKKGWKRGKNEPVKNVDLWKRLLKAKEPHKVTFIWVKGHDGHEMNERCDYLATSAADGEDLLVDPGV